MPPLTPEQMQALIAYLVQQGGMGGASLDASFGRAPGDIDKDGNLLPQDMGYQEDALAFLKSQNSYFADPVTGAMAGNGAFDYSAFEPEVDRENPIERPGQQQLDYYSQRNPGTYEGLVAQHMGEGGTASSAYAAINDILNGPDSPEKATLLASIPPAYKADGTPLTDNDERPLPDLPSVMSFARDLEGKIASDPAPGEYVDPVTGQSFNVNPSKAAQAFTDKGWALPSDRYNIQDMMGEEWTNATGGGLDPESFRKQYSDQLMADMVPPGSGPDRDGWVDNLLSGGQRGRDGRSAAPGTPPAAARPSGGGVIDTSRMSPEMLAILGPDEDDGKGLWGRAAGGLRDLYGGGALFGPQGVDLTGVVSKAMGEDRPQAHAGGGLAFGTNYNKKSGTKKNRTAKDARNATASLKALLAQRDQAEMSVYGNDYFRNQGQLTRANREGRTPLVDQFMARRMATIAAGVPGGVLPQGF